METVAVVLIALWSVLFAAWVVVFYHACKLLRDMKKTERSLSHLVDSKEAERIINEMVNERLNRS